MPVSNDLRVRLLRLCKGYSQAVNAVVAISRTLWDLVYFSGRDCTVSHEHGEGMGHQLVVDSGLHNRLAESIGNSDLEKILVQMMSDADVYHLSRDGNASIDLDALLPVSLARKLLRGIWSDADLRARVMRSIREHYCCPLSSRATHLFHTLAQAINARLSITPKRGDSFYLLGSDLSQCDEIILRDMQRAGMEYSSQGAVDASKRLLRCFIETCRAVGFILPSSRPNMVKVRAEQLDAEYLICHLFGLPTSITGFDQLFGGGGLMLPEAVSPPTSDPLGLFNHCLPARTMVIVGQRGSGKSILAAQLAAEVAKRGGVAWYMPLEQSPEECVYTLESMCALPHPEQLTLATTVSSAMQALLNVESSADHGALVLLQPGTAGDCSTFFQTIEHTASSLRGRLKLLIIDPLNSRISTARGGASEPLLRDAMKEVIEQAKQAGTNVLLVVEEQTREQDGVEDHAGELQSGGLAFAENIADTIIRLSVKKRYQYAQRYLEIKKSRMQREQRGEHPFSIVAGKGIHIHPSPAAVHARIRPRRPVLPVETIRFGVLEIEAILGETGVYRGDVIVLHGPGGSFKTPLGLSFLRVTEVRGGKSISLLFAARDNEGSIRHLLSRRLAPPCSPPSGNGKQALHCMSDQNIRIIPLRRGHVSPGQILQQIEDEVARARREGFAVHRVMIDNVAQWEVSSPQIHEDTTFAITLVDLLRGLGVTSLLVCDSSREQQSALQEGIAANADCAMQFDRFEFRGMRRVVMRVLKSRGMKHRLESFEVKMNEDGIQITPSSLLLRLQGKEGLVAPVDIRLFFHIESEIQEEYYKTICNAAKAVLSKSTRIDYQDRLYLNRTMSLGQFSAVDELQILQLDEYQLQLNLARQASDYMPLYEFPGYLWDQQHWEGCLPELLGKRFIKWSNESKPTVRSFCAVPFFHNISLLAFRSGSVSEAADDWFRLAELSWEWERQPPEQRCSRLPVNSVAVPVAASATAAGGYVEPPPVFFDFPKSSAENYNCLFFEILLSLGARPEPSGNECTIRKWLATEAATNAAVIMRQLCRRAHNIERDDKSEGWRMIGKPYAAKRPYSVSHNAVVWRHWYTTLNQMFHEMRRNGVSSADGIVVRPLPKRVSVSGEWYLAVPAYSAAPDAGLELIKLMTLRDAELNRAQLGIGMPTRSVFYQSRSQGGRNSEFSLSPYFSCRLDTIRGVLAGAFRRSDFGCYFQISQVLAYYLKKILETVEPQAARSWQAECEAVRGQVRHILNEMEGQLDFVQAVDSGRLPQKLRQQRCQKCRGLARHRACSDML